jgi:hypothetical protein
MAWGRVLTAPEPWEPAVRDLWENCPGDVNDAYCVEQVGDGVPLSATIYMGR